MQDNVALIEAGGTKFIVGIGDHDRKILARTRIETTQPDETIARVSDWLQSHGPFAAVGIACFGPLDLDPASPTWGYITRTAKPHWSMIDVAGAFGKTLGCPVALDTDVNGAALAEWRWGAGQGAETSLYLTVGTGIGGGAVVAGELLRGLSHPEMGHMRIPRHPADQNFAGICPFHGDCLEGMASGPAITARWGASLSELAGDHQGHDVIAWYLAQAISTFQAILEPSRIILGGGVMQTPGLVDRVRQEAVAAAGGYFVGDPHAIVVTPQLQNDAGLLGAFALIEQNLPALRKRRGAQE